MGWTLAIFLAAAVSQPSAAKPPTSPLLGSWALDISTLPFPPDARPKSVTMTFSDAGSGKWTTQVDIVAPDGAETQARSTSSLDGTPAPIHGGIEADHGSLTTPLPNMLIMGLSKEGTPGTTRIYTLSPDGSSVTETHVYSGPDGRLAQRTVQWRRIYPAPARQGE